MAALVERVNDMMALLLRSPKRYFTKTVLLVIKRKVSAQLASAKRV